MEYLLDSHKLHYHFERVGELKQRGDCYPLYMEVSPVGLCNHRCVFCAYDYIDYPNRHLDTHRFLSFLDEAASLGVKSILYAGEGEPLLHKDIARFVQHTKENQIDAGMFSNGEFLSEKLANALLPSLTFLRFSFNGGDAATYAKIHTPHKTPAGGGHNLMIKVLNNITQAAMIRSKHRLDVDLGSQFVLLQENKHSLFDAIVAMKNAGMDFISIKPFVHQNPNQKYQKGQVFEPSEINELCQEAKAYEDEHFSVIFRTNAFVASKQERSYSHCLGCNFIAVLNSAGDLATCLPYWDREEFVYGNIYQDNFYDIWNGKRRQKIKQFLENELNCHTCPANCRPHAINAFLEELNNPTIKHVNFI